MKIKKMKVATFFATLFLCCLFGGSVFAASLPSYETQEGVMIRETNSGDVLVDKNADTRMYPASTTKLMTALVAMDYIDDKLDQSVTVGDEISEFGYESSIAHLEIGENYTWNELLYGMLLPSGNDAANTIAANVGRIASNEPSMNSASAIKVFVGLMNDKCTQMGLSGTHFENAHGLHNTNHYTTPSDLSKIGEAAFNNTVIAEVEHTKVYTMTVQNTGAAQKWNNTDLLLYPTVSEYGDTIEGITGDVNTYYNALAKGGKTGYTEEAGRCFVFSAQDGDAKIIGVIMKGSKPTQVFGEADNSIDGVFANYSLVKYTDDNGHYKSLDIAKTHYKDGDVLSVKTEGVGSSMVPNEDQSNYTAEISWDEHYVESGKNSENLALVAEIKAGDQVGTLTVKNDNETVKEIPLYAENNLQTMQFVDYIIDFWYLWVALILIILLAVTFAQKKKKSQKRSQRLQKRRR